MAFDELKKRQSIVWGTGPYELMPHHYEPLLDHLARSIAVRPGERVLDVGTGTGALAVRLARAGADVTGVDLAPALIETAKRLTAEVGVEVRYEVGDAENLPYEDASFDVVASSIGSMFAPDHGAVAREFARVCRPGGRLALAHWSSENGVVDMFKVMAPFMPPPVPGAGSPFQWGSREYVEQLLGEVFDLRYEEGDAPQRGESGEEVWELFSTVYGPTRTLAESLASDRREDLRVPSSPSTRATGRAAAFTSRARTSSSVVRGALDLDLARRCASRDPLRKRHIEHQLGKRHRDLSA